MRILIVEDQKEILMFLKENLEREYFVIDAVMDGKTGAFLASTNEYDLIILDNNLPSKMGIEICKELRRAKKFTPIIVLSVQSQLETKIELFTAGADDYVTKPFSFDELLARIRAILRRPLNCTVETFKIDDLTVDIKKQQVCRGKTKITLTRKEFMLLEYMIRNKDHVVTRGEIIEHVWDRNANLFSNTLETHIMTLRKKIDTEHKKKLIHTIPGRGYKISLKN